MDRPGKQPRTRRRIGIIVAWALVLGLLGWQLNQLSKSIASQRILVDDFVAYWAAGRLQLTGNNPYAPEQLMALQQSVGWQEDTPLMIWYPPWALPFILPFSALSYPASRGLWFVLSLFLILVSAGLLWHVNGGSTRHRWLAGLVSLLFFPTLSVLGIGQIGALIMAGLAAFLCLCARRRWWLAGAALALVAIKPHLLYLFWAALLLWTWDRRCWPVLLGAGVAGAVLTVASLFFNPAVIGQYLYAVVHRPPPYATPTFGALLRLWLSSERAWLQFVPSLIGLVWFLDYWCRRRPSWDWGEQLPLLLLVSLITTPFGWSFDLVVLLPAVIQAATWTLYNSRRTTAGATILAYVAVNGLAFAMNQMHVLDVWLIWMAPALLLMYLALRRAHSVR